MDNELIFKTMSERYSREIDTVKKEYSKAELFVESCDFECKAVETKELNGIQGIFIEGLGSTFKNVDRHGDIILEGAFDKTIKGLKLLPMLKDHDMTKQVGGWVKFKVVDEGLWMKGFIPVEGITEETQQMVTLIKAGLLQTLSIGGMFLFSEKRDKKGNFLVEEIMLFETSIVAIPANPKAKFETKSIVSAKSNQVSLENDEKISILKLLVNDKDLSERTREDAQKLLNKMEDQNDG